MAQLRNVYRSQYFVYRKQARWHVSFRVQLPLDIEHSSVIFMWKYSNSMNKKAAQANRREARPVFPCIQGVEDS